MCLHFFINTFSRLSLVIRTCGLSRFSTPAIQTRKRHLFWSAICVTRFPSSLVNKHDGLTFISFKFLSLNTPASKTTRARCTSKTNGFKIGPNGCQRTTEWPHHCWFTSVQMHIWKKTAVLLQTRHTSIEQRDAVFQWCMKSLLLVSATRQQNKPNYYGKLPWKL